MVSCRTNVNRINCIDSCVADALYISGVDSDVDCTFERQCEWKRYAIIVRSTCTGTERTSLRVLCSPTCTRSPQQTVFPHSIQIPISPPPASPPPDIGMRVRWLTLVIRESRSSNALCLALLLRYCASAAKNNKKSLNYASAQASDVSQDASSGSASGSLLASRLHPTAHITFARQRNTHSCQQGHYVCITRHAAGRCVTPHELSTMVWCSAAHPAAYQAKSSRGCPLLIHACFSRRRARTPAGGAHACVHIGTELLRRRHRPAGVLCLC